MTSAPRILVSQERGAIALGEAVLGLGVNTRVLMIGAHPDDEDTSLITWLARGRHVSTAYLSLTRGDGGQNLIGNELGEALGVIRTEELLAARRIDGGLQYFTRAYDFGFSKDTIDTYKHWPKDEILGDVIRVVRAFRPHVIVAVFSGTTRDGHGQHQVSGRLAREAYEVAGDTLRFSPMEFGTAWTPLKFYRAARGSQQNGTLGVDVGEYSPLLGRSFAEIAGESRSQHKSQGFGALQRKGPQMNYVRREATRVNEDKPAGTEGSLFDGIDTSWARFRGALDDDSTRRALDSLPLLLAAARAAYDPFGPAKLLGPLSTLEAFAARVHRSLCAEPLAVRGRCAEMFLPSRDTSVRLSIRAPWNPDLAASLSELASRVNRTRRLASGIAIEAHVDREVHPIGREVPVIGTVYNRGPASVSTTMTLVASDRYPTPKPGRAIPAGGVIRDTLLARLDSVSQPWWLRSGRTRGMFVEPIPRDAENVPRRAPLVVYSFDLEGGLAVREPILFRFADDIRGEVQHAFAAAPALAVAVEQSVSYARASVEFDREILVRLRSADDKPRDARVSLRLPRGLTADTAMRIVRLAGYDAHETVVFRVRGRLPIGEHRLSAIAESDGERFDVGYDLIDYDHIRRQRIYRPAEIRIAAVDVRVSASLRVGYIAGVSDNVAPTLSQLGIHVTVISAEDLPKTPLATFTTLVIGPRAYEAHPELVAANGRIIDFARRGGTVVVQYGQYEMTQPGIMPYPITINRPHDRVTHEDAPVTILDPAARALTFPNRIGPDDFTGWVQERSLYMPRTFDAQYRPVLAVSDPGEPPNRGAILVAPLGRGTYIYTTLAFFRQLPAGNPGAARLFVNLLSAGLRSTRTTP